MKVFEQNSKFNFVDENNVLVGYDSGQSCCEHASWFFSDKVEKESGGQAEQQTPEGIADYRFDPDFFEQVSNPGDFDGGGMVAFRCVKLDGKGPDIYLHLFNCHNGYYGHGFEMTVDGKNLRDGCL